jgi:putative Mg2+ transporter-C (MgtC) family protein
MFDILYSYIVIDPNTLELEFVLDLIVAIVLGTLIGIERESRGKDAGISTNCFVISGAMLFTFMSATVDPASQSRIAAQVVTGIGFLGAGLILKDGTSVRNLTTASSIWFSGALGLAIGFGYLQIAVIAALASILIPRIQHVKYKNGKGKNASVKERVEEDSGAEKANQLAGTSGGD